MKKILAALLVAVLLVSLGSAYALTLIPPPSQTYDPSVQGFIYTIEYECGFLLHDTDAAKKGDYATNILAHNPAFFRQAVWIKILPVGGTGVWLIPNPSSPSVEQVILEPDGAFDLDCKQIMDAIRPAGSTLTFSKGLVILSHPLLQTAVPLRIPLEIRAAYTYEVAVNKILFRCDECAFAGLPANMTLEVVLAVPQDTLLSPQRLVAGFLLTEFGVTVDPAAIFIIGVNLGVGGSKDVETIQGVFVQRVPRPTQ